MVELLSNFSFKYQHIRLMFQDEAGFGRINTPKYCWCPKDTRPHIPCHHIREYRYAFGAVEPLTGEKFFLVMPYCNTDCTNVFLQECAKAYPDDYIVMVCDRASWHRSKSLEMPENMEFLYLPPCTPEMNPTEQIWQYIRTVGFHNAAFATLEKVVDRLCNTIANLTNDTVKHITARKWILSIF